MTFNISRAWAATWKRQSLYMRPRTPEGPWAEVETDQCIPMTSWPCKVHGRQRETADPPRQNRGNPERHHKDHHHLRQQVNAGPHPPRLKFPRQSLYHTRPIGSLRKRNTTILLGEHNPSRRPLRPSKVWCLREQMAPNPKRHMHSPQEVSVAQRAQRPRNPSMPSQKHQCPDLPPQNPKPLPNPPKPNLPSPAPPLEQQQQQIIPTSSPPFPSPPHPSDPHTFLPLLLLPAPPQPTTPAQ